MKTTYDQLALENELKTFGVNEEEHIQQILGSLPSEEVISSPIEIDQKSVQINNLVRIEHGQGNPAQPVAVFIVNLQGRIVNVAWSRTVDGGRSTVHGRRALQPYERHFVGYHCNTMSYGSLCSRYIITQIISAS